MLSEGLKAALQAQYGERKAAVLCEVLDDDQARELLRARGVKSEDERTGYKVARVVLKAVREAGGVKERGKRPIDMNVQESCDVIALDRLRTNPEAGYGIKAAEFYTASEVALKLRVDSQTVRRWLGAGKLAGFKTAGGSEWRVSGAAILRLIDGSD